MKKTVEARNFLIAMALGDGTISSKGYLAARHCIKQEQYLQWKMGKLKSFGVTGTDIYYVDNNGYGAYEARTYCSKFMKTLRKVLYKPNKRISRKILNRLDPLGIAVWYMDDGSISNNKNPDGTVKASNLTISTCVSREDNQIIIDYFFEVWGVKFGQRKMKNSFALCCRTKEARKFLDIIRPFVNEVDCMKYKLNVKA